MARASTATATAFALGFALSSIFTSAVAQIASPPIAAPNTLVLAPLEQVLADHGETMIIGGKEGRAEEYPASFQARSGNKICTWFLVGPHVLLGAAHCVAGADSTESIVDVQLSLADKVHIGKCAISTEYWKDRSQDWTACHFKEPLPVPGADGVGVAGYEVLGVSAGELSVSSKIEISGFGCTTPDGSPVPGYRIGTATVKELPPDARLPQAIVKTPNAIKLVQSPAILCEGDSGGPAFFYRDNIRRVVIGINSQTLILSRVSFLSSISTARALKFLQDWSSLNNATICGLHPAAKGCRPS